MRDRWKTKWPEDPTQVAGFNGIPARPIVVGTAPVPIKLGRNEPCWCGSGKKYKHCHLEKDLEQ